MDSDKFLNGKASLERLIKEYNKHKKLVIGFDFDSTVSDFHKEGHTYEKCITLLRRLKDYGMVLICWTAYKDINYVETYLKDHNIPFDGINTDGVVLGYETRKPFFNALLDDRAGLLQVYTDLDNLCKYIDFTNRDTENLIVETERNYYNEDSKKYQIFFIGDDDGTLKQYAKESIKDIHHQYEQTTVYLTDVDIDFMLTLSRKNYNHSIVVNDLFDLELAGLQNMFWVYFYHKNNEAINKLKNMFDLRIVENEEEFKERIANDVDASLY